jgi:hypothetical protein
VIDAASRIRIMAEARAHLDDAAYAAAVLEHARWQFIREHGAKAIYRDSGQSDLGVRFSEPVLTRR